MFFEDVTTTQCIILLLIFTDKLCIENVKNMMENSSCDIVYQQRCQRNLLICKDPN